jgi:hypothetical protein
MSLLRAIRLSESVGYSSDDSSLVKIGWRPEEFELIMREMCLPKEFAEVLALGHSTFTYFGPLDLKSCSCTYPRHTCTIPCSSNLTYQNAAYIFATSSEQLPCTTVAAYYDPATKVTSVFYQLQSEEEQTLEQVKSFLCSASFVIDPLAPLVSIIGNIVVNAITMSNKIFPILYTIEAVTGHNALITPDDSSNQGLNLTAIDFAPLVKELDSYSGRIELLDLLCEELVASLAQILHILDRHQDSIVPLDLDKIGLQKLTNSAEYRMTSLKNLLLHFHSHRKRCQIQLTVVSGQFFRSVSRSCGRTKLESKLKLRISATQLHCSAQ